MADLTITYTDIEQAKGFADSALSSYVADVGVITLTARMAITPGDRVDPLLKSPYVR